MKKKINLQMALVNELRFLQSPWKMACFFFFSFTRKNVKIIDHRGFFYRSCFGLVLSYIIEVIEGIFQITHRWTFCQQHCTVVVNKPN